MPKKRPLFLDTLLGNNDSSCPPIWLMRQAGRYMSSFRCLRKKYSFLELCLTKELAVKTTLLPIQQFDFDAAILFSDILLPLLALSIELSFDELGPHLTSPPWQSISLPHDIEGRLQEKIGASYEAAFELSSSLDRPLIGFSALPWTLATFIIEKRSSDKFLETKTALFQDGPSFQKFLLILEEIVIAHINLQIRSGCDVIQLFDSHVGALSQEEFNDLSFLSYKRITSRLEKRKDGTRCPIIYFPGGESFLPILLQEPIDAISFGRSSNLPLIRKNSPMSIALQGNLDPDLLVGDKELLLRRAKKLLISMRGDKGFIFNLGHGVPKNAKEENVKLLVETVRNQ
jgi:uroporphyrinogen decarboxylase